VSLTPVEIRHVKVKRRPLGYDRKAVDGLLDEVTRSFEDVWRDRADLRDEIDRLESDLARFRELEVLLRNSLVSAERAADDLRAQARREADLIVAEARVRARELVEGAAEERERVRADIRRLKAVESELRADYRAFLHAALDRLGDEAEGRHGSERAA
jgi:cell division initiation protein